MTAICERKGQWKPG